MKPQQISQVKKEPISRSGGSGGGYESGGHKDGMRILSSSSYSTARM